MPLLKPAVQFLAIEKSVFELWDEWLSQWFDGQSHTLGSNGATIFPAASRHFAQSDFSGLNGAAIQVVWVQHTKDAKVWTPHATVAGSLDRERREDCSWLFLVRARAASDAQSRYLCREVASLLHAALSHPGATRDLARKGIRELRASEPVEATDGPGATPNPTAMATRLISVRGQIRYAVNL